MTFVSPGVFTREVDLSQYAPALSTSTLVLVGPATKGPLNQPTLITNTLDLVEKFGVPNGNHFMFYAAQEYLRNGRQLFVVRIGDGTESQASIVLGGLSQVPTFQGTVDLSRGVDLSGGRDKLNLTIDGTTVEFDAAAGAADPTNVTIDEIITNIDSAFTSANVGKNRFGQFPILWGTTSGSAESIVINDTALPSENAAQLIFGVQTFPRTANGLDVSATCWTIKYLTHGTSGNGFRIVLDQGTEANSAKIIVQDSAGNALETFDNLTDANVEAQVNGVSQVIVVERPATPTGNIPAPALFGKAPTVTAITNFLNGGTDGDTALTAANFIGTITGSTRTGLQTIIDPFLIDINIIAAPDTVKLTGAGHPAVVLEMLDICRNRGDCIALIDPPADLNPQQVADWHNGQGTFNTHQSFNSSYGACYWPHLEIFDSFTNSQFFIPPSGHVASQLAFTDNNDDPWFAPAGLSRGRILTALQVQDNASLGERDFLYSNGNAVNPIVDFVRDGITIWGRRTLQRTPSSLDRVNVRRLMLVVRKIIATAAKIIVFEPNDSVTQLRARNLIEPLLTNIVARRGIEVFDVVIDESINTPEVVNRNELRGQVFITPVKAAEVITIDFILLPTGAEFSEIANQI